MMPRAMEPTSLSAETIERLATALLVLDDALRVTWVNDAMADLLGVGVRRMKGQALAGLLPDGATMLETAVRRLRDGDNLVRWWHVRLTTLARDEHHVDIAMQALGPAHMPPADQGVDLAERQPRRLNP